MPSGTATASISVIENRASSSERPSASSITGATGWPVRIETPKSPRTTPDSQCRYCIQMGSFSPILARSAASASGVAFSPSIITAASAGRTWVIAKTISDTTSSV